MSNIPCSIPGLRRLSEGTKRGMAAKTSAKMSVETLASFGAKRLAEILHEHAHDDPHLLEKPESIVAEAPVVRVKPSGTMLGSIERRLAMLDH